MRKKPSNGSWETRRKRGANCCGIDDAASGKRRLEVFPDLTPIPTPDRPATFMKHVTIHSDGGCHGNPGPGGWAAVLSFGKHRRELSGGAAATTNNRMELQAAIEALATLKEPCQVDFFTDSAYVRNGILSWMKLWRSNGWKTRNKQPVKNVDLWQRLDECARAHTIKWHWLKGHAGHLENECCDRLATKEIAAIRQRHPEAELKRLVCQMTVTTIPEETTGAFAFESPQEALAPLKDWLATQTGKPE
jgi:ribonuclease HI